MMPQVDKRAAADIVAKLQSGGATSQGLGAALAQIFAHFCELAIDRINAAPNKNFLAYLDLLGNTLLPPAPARVPLTFTLASGANREAVVPAGTQIAAQLLAGEQKPVIFETDNELVAVPIQLVKAIARDSRTDLEQDISAVADPTSTTGFAAFKGKGVMVHDLYIALPDDLFLPPLASSITVTFSIASGQTATARDVVWEVWDGSKWSGVKATADGTSQLTAGGSITFAQVVPGPALTINGIAARWIRCRWRTPIPAGTPATTLPVIQGIQTGSTVEFDNSSIQAAFFNDRPIDLSKDFLPLGGYPNVAGANPKIGDTFYLMGPAFGSSQSAPVLKFTVSDGYVISASSGAKVLWEYWNGSAWPVASTSDTTSGFTTSGAVTLAIAGVPQPCQINGLSGYWVRARLTAGGYGTLPPSYQSMTVTGSAQFVAQAPGAIVTCNDWQFDTPALPFAPFRAAMEKSLSLGFSTPADQPFPNQTVTLYVSTALVTYGAQPPDNPSPQEPPPLTWQYWNGAWTSLSAGDGTNALTRSGTLQFIVPADFAPRLDHSATLYWLRAVWDRGDYEIEPLVVGMLPNTVAATQAATVRNEILGSSGGGESQVFTAARSPVLPGQQLQVREAALPPADEQAAIISAEGADAIVVDSSGIWVRWHEVADFYGSGPGDRVYVIDAITGQVTFGDGSSGRIPAAGSNNIRLSLYRSGGGTAGNRPAGNVTQMKTTVPYVDRVTNYQPASGGAEAEDTPSLQARGPSTVRHGGRAVTAEDYEDLARLASPGVARAKCAPAIDVQTTGATPVAGQVSLIVVPATTDARPAPSVNLLDDVQEYVDLRRIPTADLFVVGPPFVRVDVAVTVALTSFDLSADVVAAVQASLASYLHPLTGGRAGEGWDFGRAPHRSELFALVRSVPGVQFVRALTIAQTGEPATALASPYFLVYSGTHTVEID